MYSSERQAYQSIQCQDSLLYRILKQPTLFNKQVWINAKERLQNGSITDDDLADELGRLAKSIATFHWFIKINILTVDYSYLMRLLPQPCDTLLLVEWSQDRLARKIEMETAFKNQRLHFSESDMYCDFNMYY